MSTNGSDQDPWGKPGAKPENNTSSNNGKQNNNQSNWGSNRSNNNQSPPDIEEVFRNLLKKLGGNKKTTNGKQSNQINFTKLGPIALLVVVVLWGLSGFYTIKEQELGVVLRFGKLNSVVTPGLNWKPTFIDRVIPVNVRQVRDLSTQGSMLTKDENMVKVEMTVQYRIEDPAKYLFNVTNADNSLSQATDSALRYVIGHMLMNDILTTGRSAVREDTRKTLNEIITAYDMGLEITDVNFQSARPPEEVKEAFDDAIKAQEDEQRYIREAEAYAREKEPIARGEAQKMLEQATAYKDQVVLDAKGEVERLLHILPEYKAAPELLRERLYIETMEKVMANTPKVVMDSNNNHLSVLPLEKLMNKQTGNSETKNSVNTNTTTTAPKTTSQSNEKSKLETQIRPASQGRFN